jgi:signal peptidase I
MLRQSIAIIAWMRSSVREIIETAALGLFLFLVIQSAVNNYRVEGPSMEPLLLGGDRVIVSRAESIEIDATHAATYLPSVDAEIGQKWHPFGQFTYGDVVVFQWPRDERQNFVKRVIGLPGDRVRIELGTVFVNDVPVEEPYVEHPLRQSITERVVEQETYYVLGDNRAQSDDSRHWGTVPFGNMIGKIAVVYWPLRRVSAMLPAL